MQHISDKYKKTTNTNTNTNVNANTKTTNKKEDIFIYVQDGFGCLCGEDWVMYRVSPERDGTISMEMQTPNRTHNSKLCQTHLHLQIHIHKKHT